MTRQLRRWLTRRCPGCARLESAEHATRALRLEHSSATQQLERLTQVAEGLRETNVALGCELQRKGNELTAAEAEISRLRQRVGHLEKLVQEKHEEWVQAWKRVGHLEEALQEKSRECLVLADEKAALLREAQAYEALISSEKLRSASARRQQQVYHREQAAKQGRRI